MSSQYTVCSLFWEDRGHCYHLKNQGMLEDLLNDGWEISRVDTMPQTNFPSGAFGATNVYVLEKQSDDTKKSSASEPLPHDMVYVWESSRMTWVYVWNSTRTEHTT